MVARGWNMMLARVRHDENTGKFIEIRVELLLSQLKLLYEKCNKNPKHCHFDAEDQFEYTDSSKSFNEMDTDSLLDYMEQNLG